MPQTRRARRRSPADPEESALPADSPLADLPRQGELGLSRVIGHHRVRQALAGAALSDRLPHALLLAGPRGVGKRTVVLSLVAQHFCAEKRGCGDCESCRALRRGNQPGLEWVEPDRDKASSVIAIDQVKKLQTRLSLWPPSDRGRISVLRGADRLTWPAQDALLKTLEEPPEGNYLILTTERLDGLFPTIRSRCQRLMLAPLSDAEMAEVAERLALRPEVPLSVALGCPGRLRWLCSPVVPRLREGLVRMLQQQRAVEDYARFTVLLNLDLERAGSKRGAADKKTDKKKEERDLLRQRGRLLLDLLRSLMRDLIVLQRTGSGAGEDMMLNPDHASALQAAATRPEWCRPGAVLRRLAQAAARIDLYVDPAAALCGVFEAGDPMESCGETFGL